MVGASKNDLPESCLWILPNWDKKTSTCTIWGAHKHSVPNRTVHCLSLLSPYSRAVSSVLGHWLSRFYFSSDSSLAPLQPQSPRVCCEHPVLVPLSWLCSRLGVCEGSSLANFPVSTFWDLHDPCISLWLLASYRTSADPSWLLENWKALSYAHYQSLSFINLSRVSNFQPSPDPGLYESTSPKNLHTAILL